MADKFFNGRVAAKISNDMVGKSLVRVDGVSLVPEFQRDGDGKLLRDENGKAMVDTTKEILHFEDDKVTFRVCATLSRSQMKYLLDTDTEDSETRVYFNVTAKEDALRHMKALNDKTPVTSDMPFSMLMVISKDDKNYVADLLDFEKFGYRKSQYNVNFGRKITDTIVGRVIGRFTYMSLMPSFKFGSDGTMERDAEGKPVIDTTKPLMETEGTGKDARARFRTSAELSKQVASAMFGEDLEEGRYFISATAFGFMVDSFNRINDKNPFDNKTRMNFDMFVTKNDKYYNGQVLGFALCPRNDKDDEKTGEEIMEKAMNEPVEDTTGTGETTAGEEPIEFPF